MTKTVRAAIVVAVFMCAAAKGTVAQNAASALQVVTNPDDTCESIKAFFDLVAVEAGEDKLLILIARLGDGETLPVWNQRRLHNIRTYLNYIRGVQAERLVTAEGERANGYGRIEVYVEGKLLAVFNVRRNRDLTGGDCEEGSSSLYYPMRKEKLTHTKHRTRLNAVRRPQR